MFGRDDSQQKPGTAQQSVIEPSNPNDIALGDSATAGTAAPAAADPVQDSAPSLPSVADHIVSAAASEPATLPGTSHTFNTFDAGSTPASDTSGPVIRPDAQPAAVLGDGPSNDLLAIKQQALQQLTPLVSHLDQSPEEKFRTTMMMIQASDDSSLIKQAHEAALQINDEKARAQALLDIVNEINYFTQHAAGNAPAAA
jgi:hypothetical protein